MPGPRLARPYVCASCLRSQAAKARITQNGRRRLTGARSSPLAADSKNGSGNVETGTEATSRPAVEAFNVSKSDTKDQGAITQRLESLSETDLAGTRREDIEAAGFSEDLKNKLLSRIDSTSSARALNPTAFAISEMPSAAGQGTRSTAAAEAWTGTESVADAALRMLNAAHKPIRAPVRIPSPARPPKRIDTGRPGLKGSGAAAKGARLANARDRSSMYGYLKDSSLTTEERDKVRAELKERFTPGARPMPTSLQGLASLANERIEDAIQRGQFANLPSRGKQIERDYNASSPFLDTTEYFMNKIIQKQEIVPPWIEKQQELGAAVGRVRSRLRNDWKRHAARVIASAGGGLQEQVRRAERYAMAELAINPPKGQKEEAEKKVAKVGGEGYMSQISLPGDLATQPSSNPGSVEQAHTATNAPDTISTTITISKTQTPELGPAGQNPNFAPAHSITTDTTTPPSEPSPIPAITTVSDAPIHASPNPLTLDTPEALPPSLQPFRDPLYITHETSYLTHAISHLNSLTRSYNLQGPPLAQKPYYSLTRELNSCYADVAPLLADEIRERALGLRVEGVGASAGQEKKSVLEGFGGGGHVARVRDEPGERMYGFRQFWRDVFGGGEKARV